MVDLSHVGVRRRRLYEEEFLCRLRPSARLEGHDGCVNRLSWHPSGDLLASGSDDRRILIWNTATYSDDHQKYSPIHQIQTKHTGNIFGVGFLGDEFIVSAAMDGRVQLLPIHESSTLRATSEYLCHDGHRVKHLATLPRFSVSQPIWWTAGLDGAIRQFDARENHRCKPPECSNVIINLIPTPCRTPQEVQDRLVDLRQHVHSRRRPPRTTAASAFRPTSPARGANVPFVPSSPAGNRLHHVQHFTIRRPAVRRSGREFLSVAVNPTQPHYIATTSNDPFVRVFDRRYLKCESLTSHSISITQPCELFTPSHLWRAPFSLRSSGFDSSSPLSATHATWRQDGRELVVTYSREHIYVFPFPGYGDTGRHPLALPASDFCSFAPPLKDSVVEEIHGWKKNANRKVGVNDLDQAIQMYSKALQRLGRGTVCAKKDIAASLGCSSPPSTSISEDSMISSEKFRPLRSALLCNRSLCLVKRGQPGDFTLAEMDAAEAQIWDPHSPKPLYRRLKAVRALGKCFAALRLARQGAKSFPDTLEFQQCIELLTHQLKSQKQAKAEDKKGESDETSGESSDRCSDVEMENDLEIEDEQTNDSWIELESQRLTEQSESAVENLMWMHPAIEAVYKEACGMKEGRERAEEEANPLGVRQTEALETGALAGCSVCGEADRFVGHCNINTDIKEVAFWGSTGIIAGSDDGYIYVWRRSDGQLINILSDGSSEQTVNCIQVHPSQSCIATSGIEDYITLWHPVGDDEQFTKICDKAEIVRSSQAMIAQSGDFIPLPIIDIFRALAGEF